MCLLALASCQLTKFVEKLGQVAEVFAVFRAAALTGEFDRAVLLVMRSRGKRNDEG